MANPFDQFDEGAGASATNPFDQFDASASAGPVAAQANPFDQFDGKETPKASTKKSGASSIPGAEAADEEALARTMGPPTSAMRPSLLPPGALGAAAQAPQDIVRGSLATAMNTITGGLVAPVAGFAKQFGGEQTGPQAASQVAEQLAYEPAGEGAQNVTENLGKIMEPLTALGPMVVHAPGLMRVPKAERIRQEAASRDKAAALEKHLNESPAETPVESPEGANAFNRMAQDIATPDNVKTAEGQPGMGPQIDPTQATTNMAGQLSEMGAKQRGADAQAVVDARQAAMEQEIRQKTTLENNARLRREQEAAPTTSPEMEAHARVLEEAKQATAEAEAKVAAEKSAQEQEALGSHARAEAAQRADAAQEQLRQRQVELELAVKKQATLDQNAAERARQEQASTMTAAEQERRASAEQDRQQAATQAAADAAAQAHEYANREIGTEVGIPRTGTGPEPIIGGEALPPVARPIETGAKSSLDTGLQKMRQGRAFDMTPEERIAVKNSGPDGIVQMYTFGHHMIDEGLKKLGLTFVKEGARYMAKDKEGKTVAYLDANMTGEQNKQLRGMGEKIPASVDMVKVSDQYKGKGVGSALYHAFAADHEGNIAPHGNTTQAAWDLWKRNFPEQVSAFVSEQAQRIQTGTPLRQVMDQVKDPVIADRIRTEAYQPGEPLKPSGLYKKQGGFIKMPFGKSERVEGALEGNPLKEKMDFMKSDRRSPEEVIPEFAKGTDIEQNIAQKFFNGLTKGSIYLNERLKNPLFKYVTDQFREADNRAKAQINTYIHDMMAPALRALSDTDLAEAWTAIDKMDKANKRIPDETLEHLGYSKEARRAIQTHFAVMDDMIPKIQAALDAAGMSHIDPRAAYAAAKLTGTFRKVLMDADGKVVAALGAKTERDLARQVAAAKEHLGVEVTEGPQITMGKSPRVDNIADTLSFIAAHDPQMAEWLQNSQEALAPNVKGAKTHFLGKKGVIGMEGRKPWESDYTNAKEGFEAQIKYVQRMLEFAEKAKAEASVRPVLNAAEINQPKAKKMAQQYADFEMGKNTYGAAQAADAIQSFFNTAAGGNIAWAGDVARGARKLTNLSLLSLNPGFLAANLVQPIRNIPELAKFVGGDFGIDSFGKVLAGMAAEQAGIDGWNPIMKQAIKYAEDNHVYASDLLDKRTGIRGFGQGEGFGSKIGNSLDAMDHWLQKPASAVENITRKSFFLTMVDVLDKKGIKPSDGLFDIAANLTDRGMNRYSMSEAPAAIKGLGPLGGAPYNLMSYKFNELSRIASLMREAKQGNIVPLATSLAMQVSFAGIMGTIGYQEADWLVRQFSEMAGKPTSLTKILLDNADKKLVGPVAVKHLAYGGLSTATGVDFTSRMGIGSILGSADPLDMLMPGSSKMVDAAKSAYELTKGVVKNPSGSANAYNAKVAALSILPGGPMMEAHLFPEVGKNKNIGFNWRKNEAGVERTPTDMIAKRLGMTGVEEARKKSTEYELKQQKQIYDDHLTTAMDNMAKGFKETGKIDPVYIADFNKWKGDPNTLPQRIVDFAKKQNIPLDVRNKLLEFASANTVPGANRVMRRFH